MNAKLLIVAVVVLLLVFMKDDLFGQARSSGGRPADPGPPPGPDYSAVPPSRPPNFADVAIHAIDAVGQYYGGQQRAAPPPKPPPYGSRDVPMGPTEDQLFGA